MKTLILFVLFIAISMVYGSFGHSAVSQHSGLKTSYKKASAKKRKARKRVRRALKKTSRKRRVSRSRAKRHRRSLRRLHLKRLKPTLTTASNRLDRMLIEQHASGASGRSQSALGSYPEANCLLPSGLSHKVGDFSTYRDCQSRGGTLQQESLIQ